MDRLAGSWNGERSCREVERLPPGQVVASVIMEARWGSYQGSMQVLKFRQTAAEVARRWIGLLVHGMVSKVVGRWSGSRRAKRSLR
jgi:osmotically-inducible protein OsmY